MTWPDDHNSTITAAHEAAMQWVDSNSDALAGLVGQWVAVADGRVLSHGESFGDVVDEAKRQGYDDPLLVPVMPYPFIGAPSW